MDRIDGIKISYLGGGSRGWARTLMNDLAAEPCLSGEVRLYDLDFGAAKDNEIIGNVLSARSDVPGKWQYRAVKTLKDALSDADFVVISILPGTFDEMESDVHTPEKYGIFQSVGDTVGPGGAVRALRTIPIYRDFARAIRTYCPKAWVINFTNPMTVCTRVLYREFPEIRAFGCCHEVFEVQRLIARIYEEKTGRKVRREDIRTNVLGINHFTWMDRIHCENRDILPMVRAFAEEHYQEGLVRNGENHWINHSFSACERVKFDLFLRYGILAAAGDRHLAEFCPGEWYLGSVENAHKKWKFGLTSVAWRRRDLAERLEKTRLLKEGTEFERFDSGEESVGQIKALLGMGELLTNVNLPNTGQMKDVPLGAVVETNAVFSSGSVTPVLAGKLPAPVSGLVLRHVMNQETLVEAGFEEDMELAFGAFLNDPLVTLSVDDARNLFREMTSNTKKYIPFYREI